LFRIRGIRTVIIKHILCLYYVSFFLCVYSFTVTYRGHFVKEIGILPMTLLTNSVGYRVPIETLISGKLFKKCNLRIPKVHYCFTDSLHIIYFVSFDGVF
jgi:hypothetical protein